MESMEHEIRDHIGNKVAVAIEDVIETDDSTQITFSNDFQYDKVCEAIESGIMATNPVFDANGNVTAEAKANGLKAAVALCATR